MRCVVIFVQCDTERSFVSLPSLGVSSLDLGRLSFESGPFSFPALFFPILRLSRRDRSAVAYSAASAIGPSPAPLSNAIRRCTNVAMLVASRLKPACFSIVTSLR